MKADKKKHLFWGAVFAAVIGLVVYFETYNFLLGLWGCLAGVIAGVVKEWCDYQYAGKWDWKDFLATCVGVLVVMLSIVSIHFCKG